MTNPILDRIRAATGDTAGSSLITPSGILPTTYPELNLGPELEDELPPSPPGFWNYVGNLTKLTGRAIVNPYRRLVNGEPVGLTEEEIDIMMDRTRSGLRSLGQFMSRFGDAEGAKQNLREIGGAVSGAAAGTAEAVREQGLSGALGGMAVSALQAFVEPVLTFAAAEKIVGEEILPATPEEMAGGGLGTLGMAAGAGVYGRISRALPATAVTPQTGRIGTLARNIGKEYVAQAGAGLAQEAITNPDEFDLESVINNIANPLVLATSAVGGVGGTRAANAARRSAWERSRASNESTISTIPSAKQLSVTENTPVQDLLARIDAITVSDNWWEAGVNKVRNGTNEVFRFVGASADDAKAIWEDLRGYELEFIKPVNLLPGDNLPVASKAKGVHVYYENPFDHLIDRTPVENLPELARRYRVDAERLKQHKQNLRLARRDAPIGSSSVQGVEYRYKQVPSVELPPAPKRVNAYMSKTGDVMVTSNRLTPEQFKTYETTGFLPKEVVNSPLGTALVLYPSKAGKTVVRLKNGKLGSFRSDELTRVADGHIPVWSKLEYSETLVDDFLRFADRNNGSQSFDMLIRRFADKKGWDAPDLMAFEQFVYRRLNDENTLFGPKETRWIDGLRNVNKMLENQASFTKTSLGHKLDQLGLKVSPESGGSYVITDIDGQIISRFKSLDEVANYANSDFRGAGEIPSLNPTTVPADVVPLIAPEAGPVKRVITATGLAIKNNPLVSKMFRRADRMVTDIAETVGVPQVGAAIARRYDQMLTAVDAFTQGRAKKLVKLGEDMANMIKMYRISPLVREQVTQALEQLSFKELREGLTDTDILNAELLYRTMQDAVKGSRYQATERIKNLYTSLIKGELNINKLNPQEKFAVEMLDDFIKRGVIQDERILRYIDALESGIDLTADELINTFKWRAEDRAYYKKARELYNEGANVFGIDKRITGYSPWIRKWEGVIDVYAKKTESEILFLNELRRIGITEDAAKVTDSMELAYRYTKAGLHYKAPVAGLGKNAGELLSEINKDITFLAEQGADVRPIREWIDNFRGIPEAGQGNMDNVKRMYRAVFGKDMPDLRIGETMLDAMAFMKLGIRPILAVRDFNSSFAIASMYGLEGSVLKFSRERMRRINSLIAEGYLPQTDAEVMLARTAKTRLSKAADLGMRASLQPQAYKMILGNIYIDTFDGVVNALRKANGNYTKLVDELGDMLDANNRGIQKYFLELAQRDPIEAARFLASSNAYNVANRFGRLNNPLLWQGQFGRFAGQFGSWGLNATTVMAEAIGNSRNAKSAMRKMAKLAIINGAVIAGAEAADINVNQWLTLPFGFLPSIGGPTIDYWNKFNRSMQLMMSNDENSRNFGRRTLDSIGIAPTFIDDMLEGSKVWENEGLFFKGLMRGSGFKFVEE